MKKWISLLLVFAFLLPPAPAALAEREALELNLEIRSSGGRPVDPADLRDGDAGTGLAMKRNKQGVLFLMLPEDESCARVFVSLSAEPALAELQRQNGKKKWETAVSLADPGAEFVLPADSLTGKTRLVLSFPKAAAFSVLELRFLTSGALPAWAHDWRRESGTDILLLADTLSSADTALLSALLSEGRRVMVAALRPEGVLPAALDRLWAAGLRTAPLQFDPDDPKASAADALASWCRSLRPLLLIADDAVMSAASEAVSLAADPAWNVRDAAENGVWAVPELCAASDRPLEKAAGLADRNNGALRAWCENQFAGAEHADPAGIPWPADRGADGYLPAGADEFVFEDEEAGLWAYASSTLQVQILRCAMPEVPHRWFEAHVIFKPEAESFRQHTYLNASFKDQQIYPETLAQVSRLVFAVNGDYYPARANRHMPVGNIIRQRQALYQYEERKSLKFPNLDTLAIRDDGSFSVYSGSEITADQLLAQGDVHDALSFGPYLVRDGELRIYDGNSADVAEPRCAYGMIEPGHLFFVMVEGKMPKKGEQGFDLWQLAELMYARGCREAMNVDGGSTAVMLFMGRKLNRTGKATALGSPRNQHELFGIGSSDLVHTDMVNAK